MDDLDKTLNKIRTSDLTNFPNVHLFDKPMESGLWALWILQEKFGFFDQHFTADILEQVLLRKGVTFYAKEIERGFTRAGRTIHKTKDVTGKSAFMIAEKGKEYLKKIGGSGNIEIIFVEGLKHRTAFRKFSDLIGRTKGKIMVLDKFYSRDSLDVLEEFGKKRQVEFLTAKLSANENTSKFQKEFTRFRKEFLNVTVRIYSKEYELHDRYIITDNMLILLGRGIQEIGSKESFVIALDNIVGKEIRNTLKTKFEERWAKSNNLK